MVGPEKEPSRPAKKSPGAEGPSKVPPKRPMRTTPGTPPSTADPSSKPRESASEPSGKVSPGIPPLFSPEFFDQVNQGPMEELCDQRNKDPRNWSRVPWGLVLVGMLIGVVFAYVNIFAALAVGITVGGSFYITYFLGTMLNWRPSVINYVGGASTGASQVVIGIAFVLPALLFLSDLSGEGALYAFDDLPSPIALGGFFLIGGLYGVVFFLFYRKLWLVERPLQYPGGFESTMELLAIADRHKAADRTLARRSIFVVTVSALVSGFFVILRDLRAFGPTGARQSWLDDLFASRTYREGFVPDVGEYRPLYNGLFYLDPFFMAIGWFVRWKIAGVLLLGALLAHILPFFDPGAGDAFTLFATTSGVRRTIAAGTILGAGLVALFRLRGIIGSGFKTILDPEAGRGTGHFPRPVILSVLGGGLVVGTVLLALGGVPIAGAVLAVLIGALLIAVLGIMAVKVTGETAVQPVSPMTIVALLGLLAILQLVGYSGATLAVLALGAAAFFATGLVMSTDMFLDQKVALYVGNPPHRQAWVQIAGMVPGVILGTALVWYLSKDIVSTFAEGQIPALTAPFGRVFSGLVLTFSGGEVDWPLFTVAVLLGGFIELGTGLGTVFGIGMALQFFAPATIFLGAALREGYERLFAGGPPDRQTLARIAAPTGVFVGASLAALVVFVLNQFVLG